MTEQILQNRLQNRQLDLGLSVGAGEGNRTLVISLEGCCSTIELHPRQGAAIGDQ